MSGEPRAPPPASSRMRELQEQCSRLEGYKDLCGKLEKENALLMMDYRKALAKLELAHNALIAANIPLPPDPPEPPPPKPKEVSLDPQPAEGGTRRRRRRHRRKRTSRA